jgi:hypothetical protein
MRGTLKLQAGESPSHNSHSLSLFPPATLLLGPVVILQRGTSTTAITSTKPMVLLSQKLIFPNGTEVVIGKEMRPLWNGSEGAAFDCNPLTTYKIAAISHNGIVTSSRMPLN